MREHLQDPSSNHVRIIPTLRADLLEATPSLVVAEVPNSLSLRPHDETEEEMTE